MDLLGTRSLQGILILWPQRLTEGVVTSSTQSSLLQDSRHFFLQRWPHSNLTPHWSSQFFRVGLEEHAIWTWCWQSSIVFVTITLHYWHKFIISRIWYENRIKMGFFYRQRISSSFKWHSVNAEWPRGRVLFHFSLQGSHSSEHFLPHLWSFLQPDLNRSHCFLHRYFSWSGSCRMWHLWVQVWPQSCRRTSHGSGHLALAGSCPQLISAVWLQNGNTIVFLTRHIAVEGST